MKTKTIGHYKITDRKIGEGAFGTVYIGLDLENQNREVAVKIVEHSRLEGDALDYFYEEIMAMKSCVSDNIVKLYDIKKTENHFYVFLEYCSDGDLQKYIRKKGRLPQQEALMFFWEIVSGFRTIVKSKRIHRDLKPANIFIKHGHIKIGDFGLAKILTDRDMTTTFAGSPYNMAPEVLGRQKYDNRVDIYGIGTVLYEMLFGCPPFKAATVPELVQQINFRRYRKFDKHLISEQTYSLLTKMLKPDPQSRIGWQQLFAYNSRAKGKGFSKVYKKYEDLSSRASFRNLDAVSSIFCLLNTTQESMGVIKQDDDLAEFLDMQLSTRLFISLVQRTDMQQSHVQY